MHTYMHVASFYATSAEPRTQLHEVLVRNRSACMRSAALRCGADEAQGEEVEAAQGAASSLRASLVSSNNSLSPSEDIAHFRPSHPFIPTATGEAERPRAPKPPLH